MESVPGAVATGQHLRTCDPVATAPGTDHILLVKVAASLCESLCALCVKSLLLHKLLQKINVNSRLTVGDHNRIDRFPIKLNRPGAANDPINVTEFAQSPQGREQ